MRRQRPIGRRLQLLAAVYELTAAWIESRADDRLLKLAQADRCTGAWILAGKIYPSNPPRGQVYLAQALQRALNPPENAMTPGQVQAWREDLLQALIGVEAKLAAGPDNIVPTAPWRVPAQGHVQALRSILASTKSAALVHGVQVVGELADRKFFMRSMTLELMGMTGRRNPHVVAALARAAFPARTCDAETVRRATESLGDRGLLPQDAHLSDEAWTAQAEAHVAPAQNRENQPNLCGHRSR